MHPQKSIFCGAHFGSTTALDSHRNQCLSYIFLNNKRQRSFFGNHSSFISLRSFLRSNFSAEPCCRPCCRCDQLCVNSFVVVNTYLMDQTSTTHSVDERFICAVFNLPFSKQCKIQYLNPQWCRLMVNSMKTSSAWQSTFATPAAQHMK